MANTRLTQRKQFLYVARGARAARRAVVVQARKAPLAHQQMRTGFTATKKTGNAVRRNRAKRRLRAAVNLVLGQNGVTGWDYVFIARKDTADINWYSLLDQMKSALLSLHKYVKDTPANRQKPPVQTRK